MSPSHDFFFFISDLTNSDTIRYYCETSELVKLCIALFLWCKRAFYRDQLTSKCEYILWHFVLAKDKFTIKGIQHSRSEYIFLVPALSSARTYPFGKNKVNQKMVNSLIEIEKKRQIEGSWYLARASFSSIFPTWTFNWSVYSRWIKYKKTIKRFYTSHNSLVIASDNHKTRSQKTVQRISTSHID